ncbi:MAG: hypothetical protein ACPHTD_01780 [Gammaproteobacteria bacterium]|jgi:3-hydroxy-9,10-secoandrosta-1,3,5(10)-triene-9,17-dione monooxygenase
MSRTDGATTKAELLERVDALLPSIVERAPIVEQQRRPHDDSIRELAEAGVFQALVPRCHGGHELELSTITEIVQRVSSACMSTGWVTAFYIGHNWMMMKMPERAQQDVFGARPFGMIPIQPSPFVTSKEVPGGYEISGRSSFSSGIMNADWVIIVQAGADDSRAFLVPADEVEVDDVWHMSGMAGTGSNDVIVNELFVPEHRAMLAGELFTTTATNQPNPLYAIPLLPFIFCEVLGVYSGGLAGVTALYDEYVRSKVMTYGGEALAGKQTSHVNLGDAHARSIAVNMLVERQVADTWDLAQRRAFDVDKRIDLKLRACFISDSCRDGMNTIMSRVGTRNFALAHPMQRFFRDMNTITSHAFLDWEIARELYGRQRLGLEPNHPLF